MSLAVTAVVFVAGSAAAAPPKKAPPKKTTTTKTTTTQKTTTTAATTTTSASSLDPNANASGPGSQFSVINGTANAASDHVIVGSTAFPNYVTGAVDNYYSMAHTHVDNSPFAEGTASPLDTGPVGQTAAAGNFQQPQYADARWPGDDKSGKATYGSQGQPYAVAGASEYNATAQASLASNGLSGPSAPGGSNAPIALPKGFDGKLRQALAGWKAKWQGHVIPKPAVPVPVPIPTPSGKVPTPTAPITTPVIPGVTTPTAPIGGANTPAPPVTVPLPPVPRTAARDTTTTTSSRSLASSSSSGSTLASGDGESALESSTSSVLDTKTNALVTSGESRLGRVSLGGGQIVIEGIHVSATITNDGKGAPSYKVAVSVASATIGGVPVTIDQDGVHLAGQTQGVPYKQASDALNGALKQAGIQLFLVGPEINQNSCNPGAGSGTGTGTTTTTSTNSSDPSTTASSNSCAPAGMTSPTSSPTSSCGQTGTSTSPTTTTTSSTPSVTTPTPPTSTTTKTTTNQQTTTTSTTSSCDQSGMAGSSSCTTGAKPTTTSSNNQTGTTTTTSSTTTPTTTTSSSDQTAGAAGPTSTGEMTIRATGLHVVFTQPAGAPAGVPAQNAEHILGDVFLDSLAVPGVPFSAGSLDFNLNSSSSSPSSSSSSSSCLGGVAGGTKSSGGGLAAGGLSAGGSSSSSSPSGFTSGATSSQPGSSASGSPLGTSLGRLASWARSKPKWLLFAYLVWQVLAIAAAASLWKWQGEGAS
jgi:hypothetical protein